MEQSPKESLVRDGGTGMWYCTWFDPRPGGGHAIDDQVPDEHFRTLREARVALLSHLRAHPFQL